MRVLPQRTNRYLKLQYIIAAIVPLLIVTLSVTGFVWAQKRVTVLVDGRALRVETQAVDVATLLDEVGVSIDSADVVSPALGASLDDETTIVVRHSIPVQINLGGGPVELDVVGDTVADALVNAGVDPDAHPSVSPAITTPLEAGMSIAVPDAFLRVTQEEETLTAPVQTHKDSSLPRGKRKVVTAGSPGRVMTVYRSLVAGGVEGPQVLTRRRVLEAATPRIIAVGTGAESSSAAYPVSIGRAPKTGRKMRVVATGYSPREPGLNFTTATGTRARRGVIAVDPDVIPYGTRVYVPGYGFAVAEDCGGAIDLNRIDLCFDTVAQAIRWGRRSVTIVVLGR